MAPAQTFPWIACWRIFRNQAAAGVLVLAVAALAACGQPRPAAHAPVEAPPPPAAAPAGSDLVASEDFPNIPADYAAARAELLRRGLTIAPEKAERPDDPYPELVCGQGSNPCRALFLQTDAEGWRRYVVVDATGAPPRVIAIRRPLTVEGLPSIPPPPAKDIPKLANSYWPARAQLLRLGYRPTKAAREPYRVCAKAMASADFLDCEADTALPEVENCSRTGMAFCTAYWIGPDGRVLKVITIGEPQPGGVYHLAWAKASELAGLPPGWKG